VKFPFEIAPQSVDEAFMLEALKEAWKAYTAEEVPVGAVLVKKGKVIAKGYNQVELLKDATAHAEMLCLSAGESAVDNWRLLDTTLYCTLEPCLMCAGAMHLTRIAKLVYGAPDLRHGVGGSWINLFSHKHPIHVFEVQGGLLASASAELMRMFFQKRREVV
jgi:tRNA(adenine34) deaminase